MQRFPFVSTCCDKDIGPAICHDISPTTSSGAVLSVFGPHKRIVRLEILQAVAVLDPTHTRNMSDIVVSDHCWEAVALELERRCQRSTKGKICQCTDERNRPSYTFASRRPEEDIIYHTDIYGGCYGYANLSAHTIIVGIACFMLVESNSKLAALRKRPCLSVWVHASRTVIPHRGCRASVKSIHMVLRLERCTWSPRTYVLSSETSTCTALPTSKVTWKWFNLTVSIDTYWDILGDSVQNSYRNVHLPAGVLFYHTYPYIESLHCILPSFLLIVATEEFPPNGVLE